MKRRILITLTRVTISFIELSMWPVTWIALGGRKPYFIYKDLERCPCTMKESLAYININIQMWLEILELH